MLVSIIVLTYNSENYILDVLESVYNQDYYKIELIISDDASSDNTIKICDNWIKEYKARFENTKLVISNCNTGIAKNCQRGLLNAKGEWIKFIAGDDALEKNCISINMEYIKKHKNIKVIQSNSTYYRDYFAKSSIIYKRKISNEALMKNTNSIKYQRKILIFSPSVNAPTIFINRQFLDKIGGFNEEIIYMEDWPLWIKINDYGEIIYGVDRCTVKYRVHNKSISNSGSIVNSNYKELLSFQKEYLWKELSFFDKIFILYQNAINGIFSSTNKSNANKINIYLYNILLIPYILYKRIREHYYLVLYR